MMRGKASAFRDRLCVVSGKRSDSSHEVSGAGIGIVVVSIGWWI